MSGFFFGESDRRLYGYHHVARGPSVGAVLLCAPWGREYQFAHRSLHFMARQLAARGVDVLRFDYSGTGDSWGETSVADLDRWVDEVREAVRELAAVGAPSQVDVVGLRLGAFVAGRASEEMDTVGRVVLWDPIVDGAAWVREVGHGEVVGPGLVECGDKVVTEFFVDQLRAIGPGGYSFHESKPCRVLVTQASDWAGHPLRSGPCEADFIEQPAPWVEDESIWTGQIPIEAVTRIIDGLT